MLLDESIMLCHKRVCLNLCELHFDMESLGYDLEISTCLQIRLGSETTLWINAVIEYVV